MSTEDMLQSAVQVLQKKAGIPPVTEAQPGAPAADPSLAAKQTPPASQTPAVKPGTPPAPAKQKGPVDRKEFDRIMAAKDKAITDAKAAVAVSPQAQAQIAAANARVEQSNQLLMQLMEEKARQAQAEQNKPPDYPTDEELEGMTGAAAMKKYGPVIEKRVTSAVLTSMQPIVQRANVLARNTEVADLKIAYPHLDIDALMPAMEAKRRELPGLFLREAVKMVVEPKDLIPAYDTMGNPVIPGTEPSATPQPSATVPPMDTGKMSGGQPRGDAPDYKETIQAIMAAEARGDSLEAKRLRRTILKADFLSTQE